ncbi:MAG: DUF2510 domain-containing protein [Cryobacterium sp.]|nr:DUF2510 domain-containing protein [Cryobacterium sp.]
MTTPQPGWYPDPENRGGTRWWDGIQWTDHRSAPYATPYSVASAAPLKAPEGTDGNTAWIWLVVFLPMLPLLALLTDDWSRVVDLGDPTGLSTLRYLLSPGYLIAVLGGWIVYGVAVWFSYLDWKELTARSVPRPFHWAWSFLSSAVYVIGRSVVVRKRTGRGQAPLWAQIVMLLAVFAIVIYITVAMTLGIIDSVSTIVR